MVCFTIEFFTRVFRCKIIRKESEVDIIPLSRVYILFPYNVRVVSEITWKLISVARDTNLFTRWYEWLEFIPEFEKNLLEPSLLTYVWAREAAKKKADCLWSSNAEEKQSGLNLADLRNLMRPQNTFKKLGKRVHPFCLSSPNQLWEARSGFVIYSRSNKLLKFRVPLFLFTHLNCLFKFCLVVQ